MTKKMRELIHLCEANKIITKEYADTVLSIIETDLGRAEKIMHGVLMEKVYQVGNETIH